MFFSVGYMMLSDSEFKVNVLVHRRGNTLNCDN